jgi:hypothetical protein
VVVRCGDRDEDARGDVHEHLEHLRPMPSMTAQAVSMSSACIARR